MSLTIADLDAAAAREVHAASEEGRPVRKVRVQVELEYDWTDGTIADFVQPGVGQTGRVLTLTDAGLAAAQARIVPQ